MKKAIFLILAGTIISGCSGCKKEVHPEITEIHKTDSVSWFEEAKFGMFIHWGVYSQLGGIWEGKRYYGISEWIMRRAEIPVKEYEKLADTFNPVKFNAEEWVMLAKHAGIKYITVTSKHHDGFAMYHSKVSSFNIVDATPFKRDPLKELADACKKHGIRLGIYYSQTQDWHEPDAAGNDWDFDPDKKNFETYLENKCRPQLEELLTNYGDLGILWFDTPGNITREESQRLVDWVHSFQPACLTSSRIGNGLGDYLALSDHQLPDSLIDKPFEALFTHNDSWGYTHLDKNYRSVQEILKLLIETNSKGGNLLFNIGPKPDGTIPEQSQNMLLKVGEWLEKNKEAIWGTTHSLFPNLTWGFCTSKPGIYYFHVFDWPEDNYLRIPDIAREIKSVSLLTSGKKLKFKTDDGDVLIHIPPVMPDKLCTVIKVNFEGEPDISNIITLMEGYPTILEPQSSRRTGKTILKNIDFMEEFGDWKHALVLDGWTNNEDMAEWVFHVGTPGSYRIVLDYSNNLKKGETEGLIRVEGEEFYFESLETGNQIYHFYDQQVGMVYFDSPGIKTLTINPLQENEEKEFIRLRSIKLLPLK